MRKKYYTKHSVLTDMLIDTPCSQAIEQIQNWFSERDYRFIFEIGPSTFIREIEIRLNILHTLTFGRLYIGPPDICAGIVWKHSCLASNAKLTSLSTVKGSPQGSFVSVEKSANLIFRHELAKEFKEPIGAQKSSELSSRKGQIQVALSRQEYFCSLSRDDKQILLSVDLSGSNRSILDEVELLLSNIRKTLNTPEPNGARHLRNNKSLSSFMNQYSLQYLDLLIYRIQPEMTTSETNANRDGDSAFLRPEHNHLWDLTDTQVADIMSPIHLDGETVKGWRKDTYEKKLLNSDYMVTLLRNAKKEHAL